MLNAVDLSIYYKINVAFGACFYVPYLFEITKNRKLLVSIDRFYLTLVVFL